MKAEANRKRTSIFGRIFLVSNLFFIVLLVLSYLSPCFDPRKNSIMPFLGLLYPYFLIVNILFSLAWLARGRAYFLLSLITILAGWHFLSRMIQFHGRNHPGKDMQVVRLYSYNVQNLSRSNTGTIDEGIRNSIMQFFSQQRADIICLQEVKIPADSAGEFQHLMSEAFGLPFHAMTPYRKGHGKYLYAMLTFSRFPILKQKNIQKDNDHFYALNTDVLYGDDTLHLYNIHLESLHFKHEDYLFISDLEKQIGNEEKLRKGTEEIFSKMETAYSRRAKQTTSLIELAGNSFNNVVMCGDFNDTPFSFTYHVFNENLTDAFRTSGQGFGNTYSGQLPSYRIDYIWTGDGLNAWNYETYRVDFSDHYPISCLITFESRQKI